MFRKDFEWKLENTIYLSIAVLAIVGFAYIFRVDQLVRCAMIEYDAGYDMVMENVYVPSDMPKDKREAVMDYVEEGIDRNTELFGSVTRDGVFIFTDSNEEAISYRGTELGVTHHSVFGLYVVIGPLGMNEDVVSHEMAHSELASRLGWYKFNRLPIWFNEGVATQVDGRNSFTGHEEDIEIKNFTTPDEFYSADMDDRIDNYMYAKNEVGAWLQIVGSEGLNQVVDSYKDGEDFSSAYGYLLIEGAKNLSSAEGDLNGYN